MINESGLMTLLADSLASYPYHYSDEKTSISSVAIIFKSRQLAPKLIDDLQARNKQDKHANLKHFKHSGRMQIDDELDLLFIQRASSAKDIYSGQIAFPGGKNEKQENDFRAALRETLEEVGLDLLDSKISTYYLGRLPKILAVRKQQSQRALMVCGHVFVICDPNDIYLHLKTNPSEVGDYKWTSLRSFTTLTSTSIRTFKMESQYLNYILDNMIGDQQQLKNLVKTYTVYGWYQKLECGMQEQLYGISLNILQQLFQQIFKQITKHKLPQDWPGILQIAQKLVPVKIKYSGDSYIGQRLEKFLNDLYYSQRYANDIIVNEHQLQLEIKYLISYQPKL